MTTEMKVHLINFQVCMFQVCFKYVFKYVYSWSKVYILPYKYDTSMFPKNFPNIFLVFQIYNLTWNILGKFIRCTFISVSCHIYYIHIHIYMIWCIFLITLLCWILKLTKTFKMTKSFFVTNRNCHHIPHWPSYKNNS